MEIAKSYAKAVPGRTRFPGNLANATSGWPRSTNLLERVNAIRLNENEWTGSAIKRSVATRRREDLDSVPREFIVVRGYGSQAESGMQLDRRLAISRTPTTLMREMGCGRRDARRFEGLGTIVAID
ncbi:hypothetical protein WN48_08407 [Eufriesea mexicana]|uniref:Uncharacterized protein n=1 Tax=Eufriesea mexicana TaxID=516756 RepID=A0A310SAN0_9HYME|nr:hypothetical protein WN48_08407 [Eufriesea mexicana]